MIGNEINNLVAQLAELCIERRLTVTCAESCTGGGIAYALTSIAGSSAWFNQSYVTYANAAKETMLAVDSDTLEHLGAVSQETVEQMALGAQQRAKADVSIATSGIAGPGGGSKEKPVGTVWFAWAVGELVVSEKKVFAGNRQQVRECAIQHALAKVAGLLD